MSLSLHELAPAPSLDLSPEEDLIALRRDFHAHPEIGFEEVRTAGIVAQRLRDLGLTVRENIGVTGVVGILRGAKPGKTVLVRADMDALPIEEENSWAWKSGIANRMHACGHDAHTATGLTVARLLAAQRETLAGNVVFMFQPAEEGLGGAQAMLDDGLLDGEILEGLWPDMALALHVWSDTPTGIVAISNGPVMAATDEWNLTIRGKGGHGAMPHQTIDPIVVGAHVVSALQTVVARTLHPQSAGVVTVGKFHAGLAFNVIPDVAYLSGTTRAFDPEVRASLEKRTREICETIPRAWGATTEWTWKPGYPATVNNAHVCDIVRGAARKVVGENKVTEFEGTLGAEDMALILEKIPGCYFFVGGRNEEIDATWPHHHPKFNICETSLWIGTQTMVEAVLACLKS